MSPATAQLIMAVIFGGIIVAATIWALALRLARQQEREAAMNAAKQQEGADSCAVAPPAFAQARGHSQRHIEVPDGFDYVPD